MRHDKLNPQGLTQLFSVILGQLWVVLLAIAFQMKLEYWGLTDSVVLTLVSALKENRIIDGDKIDTVRKDIEKVLKLYKILPEFPLTMKNIYIPVILLLILYISYSIKANSKSTLDIFPGHSPKHLERISGGIIQCKWFPNPHHCQ